MACTSCQTVNAAVPTDELPRIQSSVIRLPDDPFTEIVLLTSLSVDGNETVSGSHESNIFGAGREIRGIPPLLFDIHGGPNDADSTAFSRTAFSWWVILRMPLIG